MSHPWLPYTQMALAPEPLMVRGTQNSRITLADGRELVDGISSWWSACHGYNHPYILKKISQQLNQMPHVMLGGLVHEPVVRLSKALCKLLPSSLNHVFFSESGSVAVEIALKMVIQYWLNLNQKQRTKFIHFQHGYHGDTFYAMSVCCPIEGMHQLFGEFLPQQALRKIPKSKSDLKSFESFLEKNSHQCAGLIIEPLLQGAGGMKIHSADQLNELVRLAHRYDLPVIFDEIFTGFGRTKTMFATDQIQEQPDIVCLGKGLTGGVTPLAATIASDKIYYAFWSDDPQKAFMHGPTFTGHALGCAAALASLELFDMEPRLQQAASIESYFYEWSTSIKSDSIKEIRVLGAMLALEYNEPFTLKEVSRLRCLFIEEGVWIRPFGNIIYLAPALNIPWQDLETLCFAIKKVVMS